MLTEKITLLTSNLRILPNWVYAAYAVNLLLMLLWHYNLRLTQGFTVLLPSLFVLAAGIISNVIIARMVHTGIPQSLLMPFTTSLGQLMPLIIGMLVWGEPASIGRVLCLLGAVVLVVMASLL